MTYREFYTKVKAIEGISDEMVAFADKAIAQIDHKNENRKNGNSKSAQESQAIKTAVLNMLADGEVHTAKQVYEECELKSTQQASGVLVQLVKDGTIEVQEFTPTGKKKDTVKGYFIKK